MSSISVHLLAVHDTVHDSRMKLNYSEPKIYTGSIDPKQWSKLSKKQQKDALTKSWYVYYSFRDPKTGKLKRQSNIKGGANSFSNKRDRLSFLKVLQRNLLVLLQAGFNPYKDNSELIENFIGEREEININQRETKNSIDEKVTLTEHNIDQKVPISTKNIEQIGQKVAEVVKKAIENEQKVPISAKKSKQGPKKVDNTTKRGMQSKDSTTIKEAFDFGMKIKKKTLNENSYPKYKSRINRFQKWLEKNKTTYINEVNKHIVVGYLNSVLEQSSARNRNNDRTTISSLFTTLENNEIINDNFILKINVLKTKPERNKTFTPKQVEDMNTYMDEHDPLLKLFTEFVSYNFLRPIEVCRLKIKDVDVLDKKLFVRAKNKAVKIKIIPDILLQKLPDLSKMNENHYLFTPTQLGGIWDIAETDKRNYFSRRFRKIKVHFNMGKDYGLYSYRHTFITKIYREMAKTATPLEVKSKLMVITGHSSVIALEKYLRDIDAVLPEDYSHLLNKN